jgi:hypothetical protein
MLLRILQSIVPTFGIWWAAALVLHLFGECVWIVRRWPEEIPPCRRWWCPQTWAISIQKLREKN